MPTVLAEGGERITAVGREGSTGLEIRRLRGREDRSTKLILSLRIQATKTHTSSSAIPMVACASRATL